MNSLSESFLCAVVRLISAIICCLPYRLNFLMAREKGLCAYYLLGKKRNLVKENLKTAFGNNSSPQEIRRLSKQVFQNFMCSCMDVLYIPQIKKQGLGKTVTWEGRKNVANAMAQGKGCVFLAMHAGSWELASVVGSMLGYPYHVVANDQPQTPLLNELLNDYRRQAGAKVILPGVATREILRALTANEIVALVLDQGGKEGIPVEFFGKTASMSTGAIRLGLKYQVPICPVWMQRDAQGKHVLNIMPALTLSSTDNIEKDVRVNVQKALKIFEELLMADPSQYMWFYKVYKYSTQREGLILDDGKTGHLRQSQGMAETLNSALNKDNKQVRLKTVRVEFRTLWFQRACAVYCVIAQLFGVLRKSSACKFFLTSASYKDLSTIKADYIISCGSQTAGISFLLSGSHSVKPIHILKPGLLNRRWFSLIVFPEHDKAYVKDSSKVVLTKVALNLITPQYLKEQEEKLLLRYSHLKSSVRSRIGLLLGGNTKGVVLDVLQIRSLIRQLKEAAGYFNMELLVTTSRRTPPAVDEMLIKELRNFDRCSLLVIANEANVPEAVGGILGLSDMVVVSGESISMVSEAVSSGKRTIVFSPTGEYAHQPTNKYDRFVLELNQQGYLLASSIKDISQTISNALKQKIYMKNVEDREMMLKKIEAIL